MKPAKIKTRKIEMEVRKTMYGLTLKERAILKNDIIEYITSRIIYLVLVGKADCLQVALVHVSRKALLLFNIV